MLDFLRGLCYFYTVREENKAEFHSHLSARDAARVYIAQYYRHWSVYQWVYESVDFCPHFFHVYERPGLRLFFPEIQRATRSQGFIIYYVWRCTTISNLMINEQIRDKEVRLIGADGAQLGIMSAKEAMFKAQEAGLDLVKIAPQAKPPVCKIIDYGKYRYELARKEKEAKKKQKTIDVKEVRLSPNIDTNDLKTKVNAARKFLTKGDRVKVTLRFRGREMAHMASSRHVLDDFAELLADIATVEKAPKVEGRSMTMFLSEKR